MTMDYILSLNARRFPHKIALVAKDAQYTFSQLEDLSNRFANSLSALGIKKSDRVAYLFTNSVEQLVVYFAVQKIGAVAVPLNHRLVWREVRFLLTASEAKAFIYSDLFTCIADQSEDSFEDIDILIRVSQGGYDGVLIPSEHLYSELMAGGSAEAPAVEVYESDLCRIQYTGGTTGIPKGVMHTHYQDFMTIIGIFAQSKIAAEGVVMSQSPVNHHGGYTWIFSAMLSGCTYIMQDSFDVKEILETIEKYKVTHLLLLPPSSYLRLCDSPTVRDYDLSNVKVIQTSAGGTSAAILEKIFNTFPECEIHYGWGQTESGIGTRMYFYRGGDYSKTFMTDNGPVARIKSIGRAGNFMEYKIVNDAGEELPAGGIGECLAKGPSIMSGYYNQPKLTGETFTADGWLRTGDMFCVDEDGYFYMMGRRKDMIKSGGENVFAAEVENVIRQHPCVAECAVLGIPDKEWGEAVASVIKPREGVEICGEDIEEHCKAHLSSYKKPKKIVFVDKSITDSAGKINKSKLIHLFEENGNG